MNILKRASLYAKGFTKGLIDPTGIKYNSSNNTNVSWIGIGGSFDSHSDEVLLREGFMGNSDAFSIIVALASETADIIYDTNKDGELLTDGIIYDIINGDNKEHISSKIEKAVINIAATGDLFIWKVIGAFDYPTNIKVLRSSSVEIVCNSDNEVIKYLYRDGGITTYFLPEEIIHIKNYNPSDDYNGNHRGLSRFQPGYNSLKASNNREVAAAHTLENLGVSGIISDKSGTIRDEKEDEASNNSFMDKLKGAHKSGQFQITSADIEVHQLGMSPKDLEITKSAPIHLRKLAAMFGVSSRPFNDPNGSTYNNSAVDDKNFFIKGVKKIVQKIVIGISMDLSQYEDGVSVEANYSKIEVLQGDQIKLLEKQSKASDNIVAIITNSSLSNAQKIFILVNENDMNEDIATTLVNNGKAEDEGDQGN